jgi:hypothetical protein
MQQCVISEPTVSSSSSCRSTANTYADDKTKTTKPGEFKEIKKFNNLSEFLAKSGGVGRTITNPKYKSDLESDAHHQPETSKQIVKENVSSTPECACSYFTDGNNSNSSNGKFFTDKRANAFLPSVRLLDFFKKKSLEWKSFNRNLVDSHCHFDMMFAK